MPLRPVVFVGVGGSGNKTLRTLRQSLLRRLRQSGWDHPDLPDAWQMVAIDTVTEDSPDGYPAPLLPGACYLGLVPKARTYDAIVEAMVNNTDALKRQDAFAGWLAKEINGDVAYGAGQNRAVGRAVSAAYLKRIKDRLQEAYQAAANGEESLTRVADLLGATGASANPFAVVISSLSGGTGSGMFLDVVEALKAVDHNLGRRAQVVLYGPDIFGPLVGTQKGAGIPANTLAATMEITCGVWRGEPSAGTAALYEGGGVGHALTAGRPGVGSFYNYIIGATNTNGLPIGVLDDAYRATGDALTSLVADEQVLSGFDNFFRINTFENSGQIADNSPLKPHNVLLQLPMASFGSARVSLGMEAFSEYSAELVGRKVTEDLLYPQFYRAPNGQEVPAAELVAAARDDAWFEFLGSSGLNERNPANDVCDGIAPVGLNGLLQQFAAGVVNHAMTNVAGGGIRPDMLANRIVAQFNADKQEFLAHHQIDLYSAARVWARNVEPQLLRLVAEHSSRLGLSVVAALLAKLRAEVEFSITQLRSEAQAMQNALDGLPGQMLADLSTGGLTTLPPGHPNIRVAQGHVEQCAGWLSGSARYDLSAGLLRDICDHLLLPLEHCVNQSRAALLNFTLSDKTADGRPNPMVGYPSRGSKPGARFQPGPTEFLLIDPDSYPELLKSRVQASVVDGLHDQWFERLCERSVLGLPIDERGDRRSAEGELRPTTLFAREPGWMPVDAAARWGDGAQASSGVYRMPTEPESFTARAKEVVGDPETSLGKFVHQSLQHYLEVGDTAERTRREDAFVLKLKQSFAASAPLVEINAALVAQLHPGVDPSDTHRVVSKIPIQEGSSLYDRVRNELGSKDWDEALSPKWFGVTNASQIDVFQALPSALHAMAFSSLFGPVNVRWQQSQADRDIRAAFWGLRRARPLLEAIPLSEEALNAFVRGWIIAGWLGMRREDNTRKAYGPRVDVWDTDARGGGSEKWISFPYPLLGFGAEGRQQLPSVLKSCALAMVEVNAVGNLQPLRPYECLMDIGRDIEGILDPWVQHGKTPDGVATPNVKLAGSTSDSSEARRDALMATLDQSMKGYRDKWATVVDERDTFVKDLSWEMRTVISAEFDRLRLHLLQYEDQGVQY